MVILGRNLTIEYRLGVGFDLEFPDSRPVWIYNVSTESIEALPFQGVVLHLPLCIVTFGRVYQEIYE
jgi:hypothetical protein